MSASQPARKRLPVKPSEENLRKQAKRLAKATGLSLSEAQHQLAREYGARNWSELMHVVETMLRGAHQRANVANDFEALPNAANAGELVRVRDILASGAFTQHDLDLALARSVLRFRERAEIAKLLLEHGADPDGQYGSDYGPIVFVTGECHDFEGLQFLVTAGCDVTFPPIATKYGPQCPLSAWLGSYVRGRNDAKRKGIDLLLSLGAHVPIDITPALLAIHRDDAEKLSAANPDVRAVYAHLPHVSECDLTHLHYACEFGAASCVNWLTQACADVNARTREGATPLHLAARGADENVVMRLLDAGARPWLLDNQNREPRHYAEQSVANSNARAIHEVLTSIRFGDLAFQDAVAAIDTGDVGRLQQLLNDHPHLATSRVQGGDAITRGYFSKPTLLHFIANNPGRTSHMPPRVLESINAILDAGAAVDASTLHTLGGTTLALVASSASAHDDGMVEPIVRLLVSRGAKPDEGIPAAVMHRFTRTTQLLLDLGARPTLLSAAGLGRIDMLKRMLAQHPSPDELLRAGWIAAINGQAGAIGPLIDAGLDPDAVLPRPFDPVMLHEAAINNHYDVCERLLAQGADPTIRDTQYNGTPADWARHAGHTELAKWLESVI